MTALTAALRERYPTVEQMQTEALRPVPPVPWRRGTEGMARLEVLMLAVRAGRRQ